jgi:hypothetical protein
MAGGTLGSFPFFFFIKANGVIGIMAGTSEQMGNLDIRFLH